MKKLILYFVIALVCMHILKTGTNPTINTRIEGPKKLELSYAKVFQIITINSNNEKKEIPIFSLSLTIITHLLMFILLLFPFMILHISEKMKSKKNKKGIGVKELELFLGYGISTLVLYLVCVIKPDEGIFRSVWTWLNIPNIILVLTLTIIEAMSYMKQSLKFFNAERV